MVIDTIDQLRVLLKAPRADVLRMMAEPATCTAIGASLSMSSQRVYYHVKALETAGFVRKVREEPIHGIMQGYYQATARSFAVSPRLAAQLGGAQRLESDIGLARLLDAAGQITRDVQTLAAQEETPETLSIDARISLPSPELRERFRKEVAAAVEAIARRYGTGGPNGDAFRLMLSCYRLPVESPGVPESIPEPTGERSGAGTHPGDRPAEQGPGDSTGTPGSNTSRNDSEVT